MIAGFVIPSAGSIWVGNELVQGPGKGKGVVFQQFGLFPWLTARKNVEFAVQRRKLGPEDASQVVRDLIELVNLPGFEKDRKSVVKGKSGSVRVDLGGGRIMKKTIRE